jgi:hypothetical protein
MMREPPFHGVSVFIWIWNSVFQSWRVNMV